MSARLDAMLMTEPPPARIISGIPYLLHKKVPNTSTRMQRQNSESGASVTGPSFAVDPPTLLCSTLSTP